MHTKSFAWADSLEWVQLYSSCQATNSLQTTSTSPRSTTHHRRRAGSVERIVCRMIGTVQEAVTLSICKVVIWKMECKKTYPWLKLLHFMRCVLWAKQTESRSMYFREVATDSIALMSWPTPQTHIGSCLNTVTGEQQRTTGFPFHKNE